MSIKYLKNLLKENNLKGYSHYDTKPELIELLASKGLIPVELKNVLDRSSGLEQSAPAAGAIVSDPKRRNPQRIRRQPKRVQLTNNDTGETQEFPSMYKCSKALKINVGSLKWYNNKTTKGFTINIID